MIKLPVLKDWKVLFQKHLTSTGYGEKDVLKMVYMCQDYLGEIQPISQWLGQQQAFVAQMARLFSELYFNMFGKQPPPRPTEKAVPEVLLDTPEHRKQAIRETALSISKPGEEVSDEAIFEELKRRGMKLDTFNPTATISTILNGFKPQFQKVQGKRGIFKRQQ